MIAALLVGLKIRVQKIREKEKFQHKENNDQFDDDDGPEFFTNRHILKALIIKEINIYEKLSHYD